MARVHSPPPVTSISLALVKGSVDWMKKVASSLQHDDRVLWYKRNDRSIFIPYMLVYLNTEQSEHGNFIPEVPELGRMRQGDFHEFKATLNFRVRRPGWVRE